MTADDRKDFVIEVADNPKFEGSQKYEMGETLYVSGNTYMRVYRKEVESPEVAA